MPFSRGALGSVTDLRLVTINGQPVALQADVFSRWPDGSVKWAILSFLADTTRDNRPGLRLEAVPGGAAPPAAEPLLHVAPASNGYRLRTALFSLALDSRTSWEVVDGEGRAWVCGEPDAPGAVIESNGPVRAVVRLTGPLRPADGSAAESEWGYLARLTFYRGQPFVAAAVSLWRDRPDTSFGTVRSWTVRIPIPEETAESTFLEYRVPKLLNLDLAVFSPLRVQHDAPAPDLSRYIVFLPWDIGMVWTPTKG